MESKVKSLGHPLHPMLVNFPLGLLITSVVFDILDHWEWLLVRYRLLDDSRWSDQWVSGRNCRYN